MFIKAEDSDDPVPELTSCDYLTYQDKTYLMVGSSDGELTIINLEDYGVVWRKKVCSSEIITLRCYPNRTLLGAEDGHLYFWNHNTSILQADPTPNFNKINLSYSVTALHMDEEATEGVVGTAEGIYYVNLVDQFHSLLAGSPSSPVIFAKIYNQYLLTSHENGRLKLWNLDTAE